MLRAALAALCLAAAPALADGPEIADPYALVTRPGAPTGTAYMLIRNHGTTADRLVGASSPAAEQVVLHVSVEEDGVSRMEAVEEGLDLPAGGELRLERGGTHLMFLGITDPFEDGDMVPVTLLFETAGEVAVEVPVDLSRLAGDAEGHGAHDAEGHGAHDHGAGGGSHGAHAGHGG